MKIKSLKIGLATLALFTISIAQAQEQPEKGSEEHKEKMEAKKAELFKTMDANNDGVISSDEFDPMKARKEQMEKRKEERIEEHFKQMDLDNNGMVSLKEFKAAAKARKGKKGAKRKMRKRRK